MVSPFMLVYLLIMDLVFLLNSAFLAPAVSILECLLCKKVRLSCLSDAIDASYETLFEMQKLDVAGFRRMRTISQLTFESMIQLTLQIYMLMYFKKMYGDEA